MDYELFITTNLNVEDLGELLCRVMREILGEKPEFKKLQHPYGFEYLYIGCEYFSLEVNIDDEDKETDLEISNKSYDVDTNLPIWIQLYSANFNIGWVKLIEMTGKLLGAVDGDMLLLDDCTYPVMKRKGETLFVNSKLDEYKVKYITKENLERLNYSYLQVNLS